MNGLKTILALVCSAFIVPLFAKRGVSLSPEDQVTFVAGGMAAIGIGFRFVSTGPALGSIRAWLERGSKPQPIDIDAVADAVMAKLRQRQAAAKASQVTQGKTI